MWLLVINKVKVTHQSEGHIKVKVKYLHPFKFYVDHTFCKRVVCIRLKFLVGSVGRSGNLYFSLSFIFLYLSVTLPFFMDNN